MCVVYSLKVTERFPVHWMPADATLIIDFLSIFTGTSVGHSADTDFRRSASHVFSYASDASV